MAEYIRLAVTTLLGTGLALVATIRFNEDNELSFLASSWMIPTICLISFFAVVVTHIKSRKPKVQ